ncbi:MAG: site-specific integrase [Bdellovibrionales bacterium]
MRTTLGRHLRIFLSDYQPRQCNASPNTIWAYRDSLKQLLCFIAKVKKCSVAELALSDLEHQRILAFLESVETKRGNSISTRNHRLAAIRSFFRYVAQNSPEAVDQAAQVLTIPTKKTVSKSVDYLTKEELTLILSQVPIETGPGQRDDVLLRFLHNTGARVQEVVDLKASDLRLDSAPAVKIVGKGRKERFCPLWRETAKRLRKYLDERGIELNTDEFVFANGRGHKLTRFGVTYIIEKYVQMAAKEEPSLSRKNIHPHTFRHTTALHLLQSGVDLNTIRCWLGHADVSTTNRYVELDLEMKRKALNSTAAPGGRRKRLVVNDSLLVWLDNL